MAKPANFPTMSGDIFTRQEEQLAKYVLGMSAIQLMVEF